MIKLKDILLTELEKNKWTDLSKSELEQFKQDIVDIVKNAYAKIGGHPAVKSTSDIPGKIQIWQAIDVDDDPDADATIGYKKRPSGNKMVVMGQDGSPAAKKAVITQLLKYLKKKGWYAEVSQELVDKFGFKPVDDQSRVQKILKGKDIEWLGKGYYNRTVGGRSHKKAIVGNPK